MALKKGSKTKVLERPSQNLDLNLIKVMPKHLKQALKERWASPVMRKVLQMLDCNSYCQGGKTTYYVKQFKNRILHLLFFFFFSNIKI